MLGEEANDITHVPEPICHASSHRRSYPKGLVNPDELVLHVVDRQRGLMALDSFTEGVCESRKTAHRHAHGEVLALHERSANVLFIGRSTQKVK